MKIKLKIPRLPGQRKKLRATAVRRPLRIAAATDYEEMAEPNMKLSRALLIVLVLHIVAVSGIIAFNAIKTHQSAMPARMNPVSAPSVPSSPAAGPIVETRPATSHNAVAQKDKVRRDEPKPSHTSKPVAKPADDAHKTYIVAKGDNPVTIAKKLKVPYDDLLALNHIDDPHKLQIGQKLLIPNKTSKGKKGDE
jgi:LysM repeat protein